MSDYKFEAGVHCLRDDYEGDADDLKALDEALAGGYEVVAEWGGHEGYGHHGLDAVIKLEGGRYIHAHCGGCSCRGSGGWAFCDSEEEALRMVPENVRDGSGGMLW